jgi:DeoR/GlpR family transcriptional regulator of sugar metabolism
MAIVLRLDNFPTERNVIQRPHAGEINVDVAFLGTNGISPARGLTTETT